MLKVLSLMLLAMVSGGASAQLKVLVTNDAADVIWLYEPSRIRREGAVVEVWIQSQGEGLKEVMLDGYRRHRAPQEMIDTFAQRFSYSLTQWRIDCKRSTMQLLNSMDYDSRGNPFYSNPALAGRGSTAIAPGTLMDVASRTLCKQ